MGGLSAYKAAYWNLSPDELVKHTLDKEMGTLSDKGALVIRTGKFTGRSPKDRFIVKDELTTGMVDWNDINLPFEAEKFTQLKNKITQYLSDKDIYVRDAYACAD